MDQEQLIQQLQADNDELSAKLEALQTEYDQSVANLKISEDKVKNLTKKYEIEEFVNFIGRTNEVAKYMIIITIRPTSQNDPKIILKTYDSMVQHTSYVTINVTAEADNEVSFMSDDAIEKTVNYMEENIK